ncbi:hypothetical protein [Pseudomonas sp. 31 E 6]|uniref:hypothetical protein n=1 Tax=unclassified Pseudomonas TaxID=196821 RepID=UPI000812A51B|nr:MULTISPECIES: hypothetical protein [unclassified Pseudomonas]CRM23090.1 hypothetical protein [Pseudomonas sp. 31 E 5]CRM35019.1 hypothetical protein [Pseudomonas sp. 31 E 6]
MNINPSPYVVGAHSPAHSRPPRSIDESASADNQLPGQVNRAEDKTIGLGQKPPPTPRHTAESAPYNATIYGSNTAMALDASVSIHQREQRIGAYADRVKTQIRNIESGSEGERNVKFQRARQFMEPAGYFSGGLLAAGVDPHEKITVTFTSYTGVGKPEHLTDTEKRTYFAWEIAAGAFAHDKVERGGPLNFHFMEIDEIDRGKVNDLETIGKKLQDHWEKEIATPMRNASGVIARRSGKSDAYVLKGSLQSLANNKDSFEKLSAQAQAAVKRTLEQNGQVIIPNIYGYPLADYAFVPYTPYDGNYRNRPNQGLMIDLRHGAAYEIHGDKGFVDWAKNNRNHLQLSFNASDRQGGHDAHWPKAGEVLDNLIADNHATYPGYQNFLKDQAIPIRETFNYTRGRHADYRLKYANVDKVASQYQAQNAKNAVWNDQTEVFGSSQQSWKAAKEFWGNTFGYLPVVGNAGNIVFGVHDGIYGMTAEDRVGGNAAAVICSLQLVHEVATAGAERGLGSVPVAPDNSDFRWRLNPQTSDFELVRVPETLNNRDLASTTPKAAPDVEPTNEPAQSFPGMREIEFKDKKYFVADKPDASDGEHYLLRVRDPADPSKLAHSAIVAKPDEAGVWQRRGIEGGGIWPWSRAPSSPPTENVKIQPRLSDGFDVLGDPKTSGADRFDKVFNYNSDTIYEQSISNFNDGDVLKRKLNVSWSVAEDNFEVSSSEKAQHNEHSETPYSQNFLKDLNRDRYTVQIKQPDGYTTVKLDASGKADGETLALRLKQFESAIPDPLLRSRISEVAHQGSVAPTAVELKINQLQEHVGFRGKDTHYIITYDPQTPTAQVKLEADINLLDLDNDAAPIPDMEVTARRTFDIAETNELNEDANPYAINKKAPFTLTASSIVDLKQ